MNPTVLEDERAVVARRGWAHSLWVVARPRQWVKNLFVLAPLLFAQQLFDPLSLGRAFAGFALFCAMSSSVYVLNDLFDQAEDRLHPQKRFRPLASGELGLGAALAAMILLLAVGLAGGIALSPAFAAVLGAYWALNVLYSLWLKHQVILDVCAIAGGFLLRVVGGSVAVDVQIGHWLLICTALLALFLGLGKRRHELMLLTRTAASHRQVLSEYSPRFLDMMIAIVSASTLMSYALYTVSDETIRKFHTRGLLLTLPFVLYGIFRYLYLMYQREDGGDPTQTLLSDWPMLANVCLWAVTAGVILYWR